VVFARLAGLVLAGPMIITTACGGGAEGLFQTFMPARQAHPKPHLHAPCRLQYGP
jgi:hypothetical protein